MILAQLGKGGFGEVIDLMDKKTRIHYALKQFNLYENNNENKL